jgi:hypothetical protein
VLFNFIGDFGHPHFAAFNVDFFGNPELVEPRVGDCLNYSECVFIFDHHYHCIAGECVGEAEHQVRLLFAVLTGPNVSMYPVVWSVSGCLCLRLRYLAQDFCWWLPEICQIIRRLSRLVDLG